LDLELKKVLWACRRGMLELDMLLLPFAQSQYAQLPPSERVLFQQMLEAPDPQLFRWLLDDEQCTDATFKPLIQQIKRHAQTTALS
jgi:antitoxin CptB